MSDQKPLHFLEAIVEADRAANKWGGRVHTRFPPEPNGYLHFGHAKSIVLNYGLAKKYGGQFNLRFDDTNPAKEEQEYVDSIIKDVKWLGGDFGDRLFYASDYFERMYEWAEALVKKGRAFVCDLDAKQMAEHRGGWDKPGKESPYRTRTVEENLDLFRRMRKGEFPNGAKTLRAKIDMASGNMNLRDPVMYRILHEAHQHVGGSWCIYPSYDWAHGLEDTIEGITHSICTLEFKDHRPLYDWFLDELGFKAGERPQQLEFARLNATYVVLSKRKLIQLVEDKHVRGWDDPRMPTISGMRRRGVTSKALWAFCEEIGVTDVDSTIDLGRLENAVRDDLNATAARRMGVVEPLELVIENYPDGQVEQLETENHPKDPSFGKRAVPFSKTLYIEREDFQEVPPKGFFRLAPGTEVRLRAAYFVTCKQVVKDAAGKVARVVCTYDPATKGGNAPDGRKVKGTIHWVSAAHAVNAELRLVDRLFTVPDPDGEAEKAGKRYLDFLNPQSLKLVTNAKVEPSVGGAAVGETFQFERVGYFRVDEDSKPGAPVLNRAVTLKDSWAKEAPAPQRGAPGKKPAEKPRAV